MKFKKGDKVKVIKPYGKTKVGEIIKIDTIHDGKSSSKCNCGHMYDFDDNWIRKTRVKKINECTKIDAKLFELEVNTK